jgi:hypothetical protein
MCLCEHDLDELEHCGDSGKYTYFLICYSSNESRSPIISLTVFFVLQLKKNSLTVMEAYQGTKVSKHINILLYCITTILFLG